MKICKLYFLNLIIAVLAVNEAHSQSFFALKRERYLIFHGGSGSSTYIGELSNPGDYIDAKPNINFGLQYFVHHRINIRGELTWFYLSGDDSKADSRGRLNRNLSFTSNNIELAFTGAVNLFPMSTRFYQRPPFNVYGFAGLGIAYIDPKAEYEGKKYSLQPLKTEGVEYSRIQPVIPFGLGARVVLTPFLNLSLEIGWRKTFTDYLDDVSSVHVDPSIFDNPIAAALSDRRPEIDLPIVAPGWQRGNPDADDWYILYSAKIEWYLPPNIFSGKRDKLMTIKRRNIRR